MSEVNNYAALLSDIKTQIGAAQYRAALAINAELLQLYWGIGQLIHARQQQEGWGSAVIPRLALDIHNELPEQKGFSERNIKRMLAFYRAYPNASVLNHPVINSPQFVPQPVAQIEGLAKVPQAVAILSLEDSFLSLLRL